MILLYNIFTALIDFYLNNLNTKMSFYYYISEELAEHLNFSCNKKYHIEDLSRKFEESLDKSWVSCYHLDEKSVKILDKQSKDYRDDVCSKIDREKLNLSIKDYNEELLRYHHMTLDIQQNDKKYGINKYTNLIKKTQEILQNFEKNQTVLFMDSPQKWLEHSEHLIPEWKKEMMELQERVTDLEEENKRLKENFKTNVLDIVKEYVYHFLPSFLK